MGDLKIWFFDVGHGDCAYIELPNGARMMIDCGGYLPSKILKYYKISKSDNPAPIPDMDSKYGLDNLIITHPHGDHISDIVKIHDDIGFYLLTGGYRDFIDKIDEKQIDFKQRGQSAVQKFKKIVKNYCGTYKKERDRTVDDDHNFKITKKRFIGFSEGMDLNELSWLVAIEYGGHKILFTGDMTATGVKKILDSPRSQDFKDLVRGTMVLKIPHHGRENGCSQEMFDCFENKPIICVASDQVLNEKNEGTSNIQWYADRTSDEKIYIDGEMKNRKVLTTRKDKDIYCNISQDGLIGLATNVLSNDRDKIYII